MRPFLIHFGNLNVPSFFFMIMVGTLVGTYIAFKMAEKHGLEVVVILDMAIFGIIAGILGSRIFHIFVESPAYYAEKPIRALYFWQGGFVSLGAFIGVTIAWLIYLRARKKPMIQYFDMCAFATPITDFFVRLGCLLEGCCYGKPTDFFVNLIFNHPASTAVRLHFADIPLHATQVYAMINALVTWGIMWIVYKKFKMTGRFIVTFLIYYGISRFFIEFLRGDSDRGLWFNGTVSSGQIVMTIFIVVGVALFFIFKKYQDKIGRYPYN